MRRIIFKTNGSYRLMEPAIFKIKYNAFVREAKSYAKTIFCVSNVKIDDGFFPGTTDSLKEFCKIIYQVAQENQVEYIALNEWQTQFQWSEIYGNDHYHPNHEGYNLIGAFLAEQMLRVSNAHFDLRS